MADCTGTDCYITTADVLRFVSAIRLASGKRSVWFKRSFRTEILLLDTKFRTNYRRKFVEKQQEFFIFFHTILWDFQPWILFLIPALFARIKDLFQSRFKGSETKEYMTLFGFVFSFISLSLSSCKLPHYIFPLFPFISIITSDFIIREVVKNNKLILILGKIQFSILHLFFIVPFVAFLFFFPLQSFLLPVIILLLLLLYWLSYRFFSKADRIVLPTVIASIAFGLTMSIYFYPNLLRYQSKSVVAKEIAAKKTGSNLFYTYHTEASIIDFYLRRIVTSFDMNKIKDYPKGTYVFTDKSGLDEISGNSTIYKIYETYDDYPVEKLKLPFLYYKTRPLRVKQNYLLIKIE